MKNNNNFIEFYRKIKENNDYFFKIFEKSEKTFKENNVYMEQIYDVNERNLDKKISMIWTEK